MNQNYGEYLMKFYWKRLLVGMALIGFTALTWIWMLGYLALPTELSSSAGSNLKNWSSPVVLSFPAAVSVILGIVGVVLLLFSFESVNDE
jgi:hypothetical protein